MEETLELLVASGCAPDRFARLEAGLLAAVAQAGARPALLVAELVGQAVLLGRHQRASSALSLEAVREAGLPVHRRLGGGRAVLAGTGMLGVALALPRAGALAPLPVGPEKVINRYVRGLLAGLTLVSGTTPVHYFGRDFLSSAGAQVGLVSQDGMEEGAALLEALIPVERPLVLPPELNGYPQHGDSRASGPEPVTLADRWNERRGLEGIVERIAVGYERVYGCTVERRDLPPTLEAAPPEPPVLEEEEGWGESGVADVPIGFVEAQVRLDGSRLAGVRLRGDFIAPAFAIRALESSLVGTPLSFEAIGRKVDAVFRLPGATVLGVRSLRIFAEAVLAAASA